MKKLAILLFFFTLNFCGYSQLNYSIGIGPMGSFGETDKNSVLKSLNTFSYHAKATINYQLKWMAFNMGLQINQTQWKLKSNSSFGFVHKTRVLYLSANPNLEFKPIKKIGISFGFYGAYNLEERIFDDQSNDWVEPLSVFVNELHAPFDYGITFGGKFYSKRNISLGVQYNLGLDNIERTSIDLDGSFISGNLMKNRNIQLIFSYYFRDHSDSI